MNRFAYQTTGLAVRTLSRLFKARVHIHGEDQIPSGAIIFVINHFTRIETLFLPTHIYELTKVPIWSLGDAGLFQGAMGAYLDRVGVVSTRNPDRDLLIVKSLLTGESNWIIFPEGRMVKSKKIFEKGRFMISYAGGKHPPHTGAATLALRTEFYRQRLRAIRETAPMEVERLTARFGISDLAPVFETTTFLVPVNITYYPIRARENILSELAGRLVEDLPARAVDELMTEGTMLLSGVDVDIRFGAPIPIKDYLTQRSIVRDISSRRKIRFDDPIPSKRIMRKTALTIMERYMGAIYRMTTVNHDHLFASILKIFPFKRMDDYDLRRRAYLAATADLEGMGIHVHSSLTTNQTHLLTDDRFDKLSEFLALARLKGIVTESGGRLVKDMSKFASPLDFHQVRIDNPVSVIANEVEPLAGLQRILRKLVWTPRFRLRRAIVKQLIREADTEYAADHEAFYVEGESFDPATGRPFLIRGRDKEVGVLLIHGYMAAPLEVGQLAIHLGRHGYWVYVPRLKGHGTSPEDLALRSHEDWIASVDRGYAIVRNLCDRVVVGGFSTGAALALDLAGRVGDVVAVVAVCPPRRLEDLSRWYDHKSDFWSRVKHLVHIGEGRREFIDNPAENPDVSYRRNPVAGIREVELLMERLEPKLPEIEVPTLVLHSINDPVADSKGSRNLFERLGSPDKRYLLFDFKRHGIILGKDAHRVHRVIAEFIDDQKGDLSNG
jgi:esterase/lipase/1-acyl-sn-glycerol-3-phosphate acyltransferase